MGLPWTSVLTDSNGDDQLSSAEFKFDQLQIPFFKLEKRDVGSPSVSPDGKTVGFDSYTGIAEKNLYFLMNMVERKLSDQKYGLMPSWSTSNPGNTAPAVPVAQNAAESPSPLRT